MKKSFEIYSDCLDIIKRLREIDKDYFVMFNLDRNCFELHNRAQEVGGTFCLTLPDVLDERSVDLTKRTLSQKRDELIAQLDAENEKIMQAKVKDTLNDMEAMLYDC